MAGMNNSQRVLLQGEKRFDLQKQLADTLQGRIYSATDRNTGEYCIVKETWKQLARMGRSRDGHKIPEDFLKGEAIMSYLSHCNCNHLNDSPHPGFKKILDKWEDEHCYFVAIQGCRGGELFQYIKDQHTKGLLKSWATTQSQTIQKPLKQDNEWTLMVKILFRQIVDTVAWIHSNGVCHLDLSLDNIMIHNRRTKHVKIICIGELGKYFGKDNLLKMMPRKYDNECAKTNYSAIDESQLDFTCNRRVGKTGYMAPEVYAREKYDARAADIWSLGVILYMMCIGAPPYEYPSKQNAAFRFIISGKLFDLLRHWKRLRLVTVEQLDLMQKIFKPEKERIQ